MSGTGGGTGTTGSGGGTDAPTDADDFVAGAVRACAWLVQGTGGGFAMAPENVSRRQWEMAVFLTFGPFEQSDVVFIRLVRLFDAVVGPLHWDETRINGVSAREFVLGRVAGNAERVALVSDAVARLV